MNIMSDKIKPLDEFEIGHQRVVVNRVVENAHDELVVHCGIIGSTVKSRNSLMLIIPKQIPFTVSPPPRSQRIHGL